jgi:hypothetical protein
LWFQWLHQVASPRILWSHWLHHHLSWVFMISLRSQRLHQHLMHLLGFCDLSDCIRWHLLGFYDHHHLHHHLSWDFMIITTSPGILWSSPPASPPFLGFYDHHHLHHHLSWDFMITTTYITTWCN